MSAHDPQDQHHDAPVPPAGPAADAPGARGDATPSVRDVLASCAAARTVSTPPDDTAPAAGPARAEQPSGASQDTSAETRPPSSRGRDAA
ncbi:MAG: hypothetical protein FWE15_08465 [Actinomycetia bacterium]|nr:hypothetical protein [Actinomycetes bacterium]MCL2730040.1 hypothetical protein [Actinomycetes bacterium]